MTRVRVLYSFPHSLGAAGIGVTSFHQTTELAAMGHEVTVLCGHAKRVPAKLHALRQTLSLGKWKLPYRAIGVERAWALHDWLVSRHLRRHAADYDVVHTWPCGAYHTLIAARDVGVTSFLHRPNTHTRYAYDIARDEAKRLGLPQPTGKSHTFNDARLCYEQREFDAADRLLCPSPFVGKTFTDQGVPASKISPMQYGYDPAKFKPSPNQSRDGKLRVAFIGNGEPRKGLHFALRAWLDCPASKNGGEFHFAGKLQEGYAEIVKPMLADPSVISHGFIPDPASVMCKCDVLILPTLEEGSAKVTYEARACGCVLVVSDAAGAVIQHEHNGLLHRVGDEQTLKDHLTRLCTNPEELERLRENSLREIDQLTWSRAARLLAMEYERWAKPADAPVALEALMGRAE